VSDPSIPIQHAYLLEVSHEPKRSSATSVMNAFQKSLPGWEVSNCYFHLCQAVQKHIQKQFKKLYLRDKLFVSKKFAKKPTQVRLINCDNSARDLMVIWGLSCPETSLI
jgi:hypothetical protein